jgi:hypothetical protein
MRKFVSKHLNIITGISDLVQYLPYHLHCEYKNENAMITPKKRRTGTSMHPQVGKTIQFCGSALMS